MHFYCCCKLICTAVLFNSCALYNFAGCCIYKKHREFDESSSSESDDDCENCFGHVDHRKKGPAGSEVPSSQSPVPCGSGMLVGKTLFEFSSSAILFSAFCVILFDFHLFLLDALSETH